MIREIVNLLYYYNLLISIFTLYLVVISQSCQRSAIFYKIPNPLAPPSRGTVGASRRAGMAGLAKISQ